MSITTNSKSFTEPLAEVKSVKGNREAPPIEEPTSVPKDGIPKSIKERLARPRNPRLREEPQTPIAENTSKSFAQLLSEVKSAKKPKSWEEPKKPTPKFDVAGNRVLTIDLSKLRNRPQPVVYIPIPKRKRKPDGNQRKCPYNKFLELNADGSFPSVILPALFCLRGSKAGIYPCVALTRAMKKGACC